MDKIEGQLHNTSNALQEAETFKKHERKKRRKRKEGWEGGRVTQEITLDTSNCLLTNSKL